jgi:hypothetical protein
MKKDTKDLLKTVAMTAAVSFIVERMLDRWVPKLEKAFVKVDDIETCLHEATVTEMQSELMKRQTEGSEIKKG